MNIVLCSKFRYRSELAKRLDARVAVGCLFRVEAHVQEVDRLVCWHVPVRQRREDLCSGSEAGSYLRLIDSCITQVKAQGPSGTCNECLCASAASTCRPQFKNNYFAEM